MNDQKADIDPEVLAGYVRFKQVMESCHDDVTKVLRGHLLAEYYIDRLIGLYFPRSDIIINKFRYLNDKLNILEALSFLPQNLVDAIRNLNSLRNSCSHVLNYVLVESDVDKIGRPFGLKYEKIKQEKKTTSEILHQTLMLIIARLHGGFSAEYSKRVNSK